MFLCCWVTWRKEGWKPKCFSSSSSHVSQRELVYAIAAPLSEFNITYRLCSLWCVSLLNAQGILIFVQKILCCEVEIIGAYVFRPTHLKGKLSSSIYPLAVSLLGEKCDRTGQVLSKAFDSISAFKKVSVMHDLQLGEVIDRSHCSAAGKDFIK